MIDVSIVVVSYNTREITLQCLDSIFSSIAKVTFEVIVIDNASSDNSVRSIQDAYPKIKMIANEENRGFAAANNQGISAAIGRYVLLLNSDVIVHPSAIDHIVEFADEMASCGVVGCRTLNADGSLQRNCFLPPSALNLLIQLLGLHLVFPRTRLFGRERMTYWDLEDARAVPNVAGCFMLVRSAAIADTGGMDERFFMYAEEMDWCARFWKNGWKVYYSPVGVITHLGGVSAATAASEMRDEAVKSLVLYFKKHLNCVEAVICRCLLVAIEFRRAPMRLWHGFREGTGVREFGHILRRLRISSMY